MEIENSNAIKNYCIIHQLLTKAAEKLHRIFRERWTIFQKLNPENINQWNDECEECRAKLIQLCSSAAAPMKELLKNSRVDLWDITLSNIAIQSVSKEIRKCGGAINSAEDVLISCIKDIRNKILHGNFKLSNKDFEAYWNQLSKILVKLGEKAAEIEALKMEWANNSESAVEEKFVKKNSKFVILKETANKLFKDKNFKEAIKIYDQALNISGISPDDQALIFSNRSAAYLMLKDEISTKMAERDAEWAIQLRPAWWRGYYRLARVQMESSKWFEAEKSLNTTLALNSSSKEARDDLSLVRHEVGIISRQEHLSPLTKPKSTEELIQDIRDQIGCSEKDVKQILKTCSNIPGIGDDIKGTKYMEQNNFKKAFEHFKKSAESGSPVGMGNLAKAYDEGIGVEKDHEKSLNWYLKAAEQKSFTTIGSGVAEAQHMLGVKHHMGIGVNKDIQIAVDWYKKAAKNGITGSMNNLGMLHLDGIGVEKSQTKAFQYFKMAAQQGLTASMLNLADCYFRADGTGSIAPTKEDIAEGLKWLEIAAEKGDLRAAKALEEREKYEKLVSVIAPVEPAKPVDPLDFEQFGKCVKEAAKSGSETAKRHMEIWKNLNIARSCFKRRDAAGVVVALAKAIRLNFQIVRIADYFKPVIEERYKAYSNELDAIVCIIQTSKTTSAFLELLFKAHKMFPSDEYLAEIAHCQYLARKDPETALENSTAALKYHPNNLRLLLCHAVAFEHSTNACADVIKLWDKFLDVAPKDDEKVPGVYYRKAMLYNCLKDPANVIASFEAGIAAEEKQLLCFKPYIYPEKRLIEKLYLVHKKQFETTKPPIIDPTLSPLELLTTTRSLEKLKSDPQRKTIIIQHREDWIKNMETFAFVSLILDGTLPPSNNLLPPSLVSLKKITLKEMDRTKLNAYNGYILQAKIIDFAYLINGIHTIIEDENGDIERLAIYDWFLAGNRKDQIRQALKIFRPNVLISIINPCTRQSIDMKSVISVESPKYVTIDNNSSETKCSCCGKQADVNSCSGCRMANYCTKDCRMADKHDFNHKSICKYLQKYAT